MSAHSTHSPSNELLASKHSKRPVEQSVPPRCFDPDAFERARLVPSHVVERTMIDHLTIVVSDYERSKAFYLAATAPLGFAKVMELTRAMIPVLPVPATVGIGPGGKPELWLRPQSGPITSVHIALRADDRAAVDAFHRAALEAGAKDNGAPGLRPHYHASYYGAFVLDPDGHNIEAVCHAPT